MFEAVEFLVMAEANPGLLSRLLAPFAKRDLVPDAVRAQREGDRLRVSLRMEAMPAEMVHLVEGNLRQVIGVMDVTRSEARRAAA
jgi:hypothetical protein